MLSAQWQTMAAVGAVVGLLAFAGIPIATAPIVQQGSPNTVATVIQTFWVNVTITPFGTPTTYVFSPSVLIVPWNTKVVVGITNYDTRTGDLPSPANAIVMGTVGGVEHVTVGTSEFTTNLLPVKGVSHTFTINVASVHLNAPIPPAIGTTPSKVVFTVIFPQPAVYAWNCVVLYPMPTHLMRGVVFVR